MRKPGAEFEAQLRLAVAEGVLSQQEVEALRSEALRLERDPLELLQERGRLSEDTLASLRLEVAREPAAGSGSQPQEPPTQRPGGSGSTPSPSSASDDLAFPVPGWDRYQPVRLLGQGGMGRVFLAYDPKLRRNVALKFMREDAPELAHRFLSEARAQARVRHERVCEVYEVGKVQERAYIAMQYVDGRHLGQLAHELTLEQKVLALRGAAEGVHAAHHAGLIHRDLKPSNILLERTEDGGLEPYVLDFGLARDWRDESTATGAVLGTPHYMAPEQARGEVARLDRRADVYALGATLYALLTGQPPFTGDNALEILTRIQSEEPRPPRALDKDIPADLEAIVLKCLEKERSARYDSARALAEDLERFLSGEPVRARPAGLAYRLRKKVRKHRVLVSLGSAALLVMTLALGQAVLARREVAERERLSRRFTESVERIEAMARYSAMLPLHDTRTDRKLLRERMGTLEAEVEQAGEHAVGPGRYALGRALFALGDKDGARERLEAAWNGGYREPRVAWALAQVLGELYAEQLLEVEQTRNTALRESRRQDVERRYRDPALAYLRQSEGPEVPAPPAYVAALLSFQEGRHDEALSRLDTLGDALPWLYELPLLRGDILVIRGSGRWNQGDREGALADFEAARKAFATASAIAESAPAVSHAQARLEYARLMMELYGKGDVLPFYTRGLEALSRALSAAPDYHLSKLREARFHRRLGEYRTLKGEDAQEVLHKALTATREAQTLHPDPLLIPLELGEIHAQLARNLQARGQDPREQLQRSIEALALVAPDARGYNFLMDQGVTFKVWADYEDQVGADSLAHRDQALASFQAAVDLDPRQSEGWINLGSTSLKRASHPRASDPEGDLERARDALERALATNPGNYVPCFHGAQVQEQLARRLNNRGGDARLPLERAAALYRKGLEINPKVPQLHNGLGGALLWRASLTWEAGEDAFPLLDEARAAFEQARTLAPQQWFAFNNLGEVEAFRASFLRARGEDPGPSVRVAVAAYQQALALVKNQAGPWVNQGKVHHLQAAWELEHGVDPGPALARAAEALRQAVRLNARNPDAWRHLGETHGVRARWLARRGQAKEADFDEAARAFQKALELEPERPEFRIGFGHLLREWGEWRRASGGDAVSPLKRGLELAEAQLTAKPGFPNARVLRSSLLLALARSTPEARERQSLEKLAREEAEAAFLLNPHLAPLWRERLLP
ncbi:protein kinase domain-containing protein [Archangium sp.]|uniref:protein kinase domain-containing protein n=1 Tax=Archangium sp. TaxID=1872627 RepID=UPI00286CB131|nr:protein kinase [Archangium sp.]